MDKNIDKETKIPLNIKEPYVWVATWFGAGMINPAPGTWGSLAALPFALVIFMLWGLWGLCVGIVVVTILGYSAAKRFGKVTQNHDNKMIVIDEVAGQWLALLPALYYFDIDPLWIFLSFVFFRFFDIVKPWPASYFDQKIQNAVGVMGDDIIAGLYSVLAILGLIHAGFG